MILDKVLGNIENTNLEGVHIEKIYLNNEEMLKRIIRVTSDHGKDYGISLSDGNKLKDGDILFNDGHNAVVVKFNSEDVLVIKPKDMNQMGKIAHEIGNKHLPAQFIDETMIIQYDSVVEETLKKQNLNYSRENMELKEAFRHVDFMHRH
ncbi:urease accessory protein UreE [Clostridium thermobutyricum]|uniref:Urease accessory protein UreE n=1 Tax=Clostridium thermobutyricum DSM 4928 TaxID=1121339 RepID=A0A1V4STR9_9CLOT|nr:urease accessory protein UreE [Clostridium thermobutyricum]OPX46835.1 urease accessory protein UreE [Clostridium thermobutyricum DSM 4928]